MKFGKYLAGRLIAWALVIFIGMTLMWVIPRFFPSDPVETMIQSMLAKTSLQAEVVESMRIQLRSQYGLEGTLWEQYCEFWARAVKLDFGPSLANFPTSATTIVMRYMPYTVCMALFTTICAWIIGNAIGLVVGFRKDKKSSTVIEYIVMCMYPIPYFILALVIQVMFCFVWKIFPVTATIITGQGAGMYWSSVIRSSTLPALTMLVLGFGWWVISMKAMAQNTAEEEFVRYARYRGMTEGHIMTKYVLRNSIIPQVNGLAISLGGVFGGALMAEIIFQYPGVGKLVQRAIMQADYNMIMATVSISIIAVATATLIADLIYPLIDPRIRFS